MSTQQKTPALADNYLVLRLHFHASDLFSSNYFNLLTKYLFMKNCTVTEVKTICLNICNIFMLIFFTANIMKKKYTKGVTVF